MTWTPDNIQQTLVGPVRPEQGSFSLVVAHAQPGDPSALPCPTCGCPTNGPEWAGFTQWRKLGRTVRAGEHGTACLTVVSVVDDSGRGGTRPRGFKVFHRDQTEALPEAGETEAGEVVTAEPDGGLDWSSVDAITVLDIIDTHDT